MLSLTQERQPLRADLFALKVGRRHVDELLTPYWIPLDLLDAVVYVEKFAECQAIAAPFAHFFPLEWDGEKARLAQAGPAGLTEVIDHFNELVEERLFPLYVTDHSWWEGEDGELTLATPMIFLGWDGDSAIEDHHAGWQALIVLLNEAELEETSLPVDGELAEIFKSSTPYHEGKLLAFLEALKDAEDPALGNIRSMADMFYLETGNPWLDSDSSEMGEWIRLEQDDMAFWARMWDTAHAILRRAEVGQEWILEPANLRRLVALWNQCGTVEAGQ